MRNLLGAAQKIGWLRHLADETSFQRFIGLEGAARQAPAQRLRQTDEFWQEPGAAGLRHEASPGKDETDLRASRNDPHVHRQCHGNADADRMAIDCRDRRLTAAEDRADKTAAAAGGGIARATEDARAMGAGGVEAA